ncbi:MAG: hydrogenase subunit MbhD domain-containing protein [Thermodesulfobacteriota bacterium]
MIVEINFFILLFAIITAVAALSVKDLLSAVVLLSAFSFFMCLAWTEMGAVDVAFTEAAVGAGVSTAFFVATLYHTKRRSKD